MPKAHRIYNSYLHSKSFTLTSQNSNAALFHLADAIVAADPDPQSFNESGVGSQRRRKEESFQKSFWRRHSTHYKQSTASCAPLRQVSLIIANVFHITLRHMKNLQTRLENEGLAFLPHIDHLFSPGKTLHRVVYSLCSLTNNTNKCWVQWHMPADFWWRRVAFSFPHLCSVSLPVFVLLERSLASTHKHTDRKQSAEEELVHVIAALSPKHSRQTAFFNHDLD